MIWSPQPKQAAFMARPEYEALYGGAAGGGKSDAIIIEALRQIHIPHYKALILRKTYPQLAELIDKSLNYYPQIEPRARYNSSAHSWRFPSGAKVIFGSMQRSGDRVKYQGQAFDAVFFDELTHFLADEYFYLKSRNRPNGPGTRVYIRATANPGGVGHGWVKDRFITAAPPMHTVWERVSYTQPDGQIVHSAHDRIFVPSSVFDNQALLNNDPEYAARLASLPEADKKALLYGDWDSFSGQVFTEWRNDPDHYADGIGTHVITPLKRIPAHWSIWASMDWGFTHPYSVGWYAVDDDGRMYRFRELYGCTGTPNEGVKQTPPEVARQIRDIENTDPIMKGRRVLRIADPAIWGDSGTGSVASLMGKEGIFFSPANHDRISGKMQLHNRLTFGDDGRPMLYVYDTCKHFIRTIPALVYSESNVEDINTEMEDHIYDECRYMCMRSPINPPKPQIRRAPADDPLNQYGVIAYDQYAAYR